MADNNTLYELGTAKTAADGTRYTSAALRIDKNNTNRKFFDAVPAGGSRGRERPPICHRDQIEENPALLDTSNLHQTARRINIVSSAIIASSVSALLKKKKI